MIVPPLTLPLIALLVVFGAMGVEALLSTANEAALRSRGARVVPDASFPWMQITYPGGFLAVCLEGVYRGADWNGWAAAGVAVFVAGKLIKVAAIAALRRRWTFRVLVLPDAPLVGHGIYRALRHPNYVGVVGEVVGIGLWMQAPITGTLFGVTFGLILLWRIRIEERALGLSLCP
jgi:methyltransferase